MPDGFGLIHPVLPPILERVAREEYLGRDHPPKKRDERQQKARDNNSASSVITDDAEESKNSMSSTHIDLRI